MGLLSRFRAGLIILAIVAVADDAAAQRGRVGGTVKDETGEPIRGATIRAENPNAAPSSMTATTDNQGRFSIIGLRSGAWTFTAEAPGYAPESGAMTVQQLGSPNPPVTFTLKRSRAAAPSALGNLAAKDLQTELGAADALYNAGKWDESIAAYRAILAKAPALSVINLQVAAGYRGKKDYDNALTAYGDVLKVDPNNEQAKVGIAMTQMEKGDLQSAEAGLVKAAESLTAGREIFYSLGEVKFAKGEADEAGKWYEKAAQIDPAWGKPLFKLGMVALNKGDKQGASTLMDRVIRVDPTSAEAVQAKAILEQLK